MPLLKLLGAALLLCDAAYIAVILIKKENRRIKQLEGAIALLRHIKGGISCFLTPLPELLSEFSDPSLAECGFSPGAGLERAVTALGASPLCELDDSTLKLLSQFAKKLGSTFREDQTALCELTLVSLRDILSAEKSRAPERKKLIRTLSGAAGLLAVIAFL